SARERCKTPEYASALVCAFSIASEARAPKAPPRRTSIRPASAAGIDDPGPKGRRAAWKTSSASAGETEDAWRRFALRRSPHGEMDGERSALHLCGGGRPWCSSEHSGS